MALCNYNSSLTTSRFHFHSLGSIFQISCIFFLLLLPCSNSISFDFPSFEANENRIKHQNDSFRAGKDLELTKNQVNGPLSMSVGRATYFQPLQLWDSKTGWLADFNTHFSFEIEAVDKARYGDGLSFFLAPFGSEVPPNSAGGYLGLFSNETALINSTTNQIVAVEFDSFKNHWDPNADHIGINVNSIQSIETKEWKSSIKNGSRANAWVSYNSITKNLSVYLTYAENPVFNGASSVFHVVDLRDILPENVSVGFSAATGSWIETHTIISWNFNSTTPPVRNNNPTTPEIGEGKKKSKIGLVVGLVVTAGILGSGLGYLLFIWLKRRSSSSVREDDINFDVSMDDDFEKGTGPKRFSYSELVRATGNFNEGGKLGEGGFGGVYRGLLTDLNLNIAVKRVSRGSKQGRKEYTSEVKIISRLRHRNLVQLIGWCHERSELLLVYEFMPNRSLDYHLFRPEKILSWEVRYKIALGLASALLYLHEEWEQCVVHRDIKSSNVMLDSNFNAKLGDFGLARFVDHELGSQTTVIAGTMGYLAPECFTTAKSTKESDVYSFGIVALEISCGRRPVEQNQVNLVEWVWDLYGKGKFVEAADERLSMHFDEPQIECLMLVGLWCAHPDPTIRPSIRQVINVLNFDSPPPNLPSKLPTPVYFSPPMDLCKLALGSSYGFTGSHTDGSQCSCSSCTTNLSASSSSSSASKSLLHAHKADK